MRVMTPLWGGIFGERGIRHFLHSCLSEFEENELACMVCIAILCICKSTGDQQRLVPDQVQTMLNYPSCLMRATANSSIEAEYRGSIHKANRINSTIEYFLPLVLLSSDQDLCCLLCCQLPNVCESSSESMHSARLG